MLKRPDSYYRAIPEGISLQLPISHMSLCLELYYLLSKSTGTSGIRDICAGSFFFFFDALLGSYFCQRITAYSNQPI